MKKEEYEGQFKEIMEGRITGHPYDSEKYLTYVKLNHSRIRRWYKTGDISDELRRELEQIDEPQEWVLITEPWCGDAANSHAFIVMAAESNPNIRLNIQNRDSDDSEIDTYLTNGSKSIPKLIVRDIDGNDLFTWGPRPKEAQELALRQKDDPSLTSEEKSIRIQKWYNQDKGQSLQSELTELLQTVSV